MTPRAADIVVFNLMLLMMGTFAGCDSVPGRRAIDGAGDAPGRSRDFAVLYGSHCAACHGANGSGGAATALANPVYLAIVGDDALRETIANGVPRTPMPAFASGMGGSLTDEQIDVIVTGMRRWSRPHAIAAAELPKHTDPAPGDVRRGASAFATYCASCHGEAGKGASGAGSVVDAAYLALASDQGLRTTVIVGVPDAGAPDWRGNVPGRAMTAQEISDVVAWLAAQRPPSLR